jgi:hypothetical protein
MLMVGFEFNNGLKQTRDFTGTQMYQTWFAVCSHSKAYPSNHTYDCVFNPL